MRASVFAESRRSWLGRGASLVVIGLLFLLPGTATLPLIDRDEPRFAQATREMMERHDWVIPTFNRDYRFDKPPLIYWMMAGSYRVFGVNELAARLPSVLCSILLAVSLYAMGRRWLGGEAPAFLAGVMLLVSVQMMQHGRAAVADMPMILCVFWSHAALFRLLVAPATPSRTWAAVLHGSLAIGFLAKGPVAWVVPLLTVALFRLALDRRPLPWRHLRLLPGFIGVVAVVGAWGIPALIRTGGAFYHVGIGKHVIERGHAAFNGHVASIAFYLLLLPLSLFPWSASLGAGLARARRRFREDRLIPFLAAWLVGTYVLFSLYATKLPHYVLPAFPAWALLLAGAETGASSRGWWRVGVRTLVGCGAGLLVLGGAAAVMLLPGLLAAWIGISVVGLGVALAGLLWLGGEARVGSVRRLLGPLAVHAAGLVMLSHGLRAAHPALRAAAWMNDLPADAVLGFSGYREPSLVFYTGRRWEGPGDDLAAFLDGPPPRGAVIKVGEAKLHDLPAHWTGAREAPEGPVTREGLEALGYEVLETTGINPARSSLVRLLVARKAGGP